MTPLDHRISAAWRSNVPLALDRAAEQLAAEGHSESAIYDALERLLLELRAAGADDETEDRVTDVMDRLTGWCHESNHIRARRPDPPAAAPAPPFECDGLTPASHRPNTDAPAPG